MKKEGQCKLCLQQGTLRNSHIFPEFFYAPNYDEKHRFASVSGALFDPFVYEQKGMREYLLCGKCEGKLSKWERYSASLLRQIWDQEYTFTRPPAIVVQDFDYKKFRLFGLSLIWRAHIAKDDFWKDVRLGPYAERIRNRLLNEEPGEPHQYAFAIMRMDGFEQTNALVTAPAKTIWDKYLRLNCYHFLAFGYQWYYVISNRSNTIPPGFAFVGFQGVLPVTTEHFTEEAWYRYVRQHWPSG